MKRALGYFVVWIVLLGGIGFDDAIVGAIAAMAAARLSLELRPASTMSIRFLSLVGLVARFLGDSLVAGLDVARRAFAPALPLRTGYVAYAASTPPGDDRSLFADITSLMPGSLPAGVDPSGSIVYHCLDTSQPVIQQLSNYEARLANALGWSGRTATGA